MRDDLDVKAVILAGGRGRRLEPYTSVLPKPLMPVGDRAIVEVIVDGLIDSGVRDITLCVGYLAHLIQALFNGRPRDVEIRYVHEPVPLGTAGPLRLVDGLSSTFLLMNGDLLTDLDYAELVELHRRAGNVVTIATHERTNVVDYGVLHTEPGESPRLVRYEEKPQSSLTVSMGIYVLEPQALEHVPREGSFDFPELVERVMAAGLRVGTFPFQGFWLDIGRRDDYEQALEQWAQRRSSEP